MDSKERKTIGIGNVELKGWIDGIGLSDVAFSLEGFPITELAKKAFTSVLASATELIATTVASANWKLLKNGNEVSPTDKLYKLLRKPNAITTFFDFIYTLTINEVLFGKRFIYIDKKTNSLWVLPSYLTNLEIENGRIRGVILEGEFGGRTKFMLNEVVFDIIPHPLDYTKGNGILEKIALEFDLHMFTKEFLKQFFKNFAVPPGVLTTEERLTETEIEVIERQWKAKFSPSNGGAFNVPILSGGLKFQPISSLPNLKDIVELAKWSVREILAILKVPPVLLGYTEGVNRTTAIQETINFLSNNIKPRLRRLEELFNSKLFPLLGFSGYEIKFSVAMPEDEINVEKAKIGATFGVLTVDEIRRLLGFPPLKEGETPIPAINSPKKEKDLEQVFADTLLKSLKEEGYDYP